MSVLHHIRHGIGATRSLDYAPAVAAEILAMDGDPPERTEADAIAAEARVHDTLDELREPTCADECSRWGDQEIGRMIREYRTGMPVGDIAHDLGETIQAVSYELNGIYRDMLARKGGGTTRGRRLTEEQVAQVLAMSRKKLKIRHIARELGIAESTVRYLIEGESE